MDGETAPQFSMPPIAEQIWDMKYRLKAPAGEPIDKTIEDTWRRIANALAEAEEPEQRVAWAERFYRAMEGFKFLPGGRIIAGAGTERHVTLMNCFMMGDIPDSIDGIFTHLREAALTMQQGGGIGYDFSTLRPKGAPVRGVDADASGPLSYMDVWDSMCRTILSAGSRRGAMMGTMRVDHPDIEAFIEAKRDPGRLRMFNLSVLVTDAFMQAVDAELDWPLSFNGVVSKTLKARDLWDKIMRATYAYAEPGVIFIDRINSRNNLYWCEEIHGTNPCGEIPMPPYGNCLLGSLNLAALVEEPFTCDAGINTNRLAWHVEIAVRMLDNVIEVSKFPLEVQRAEAFAKRRIGLGVTGLADALIMCGLRYGSEEAVTRTGWWLDYIQRTAYRYSAELAAVKGSFPLYDRDQYLAGETISALDAETRDFIAAHGMRNSHLMAIAPTGTISLLGGNLSGGIEPVFSLAPYTRNLLMPDGTRQQCEVADYAYALWRRLKGDAPLPEYFVDAQTLSPTDHLAIQATVQRYIDQSISKTINLPADILFDEFEDVYDAAYRLGCKSCTTYRPNEVTGAVLQVKAPADTTPGSEDGVVRLTPALPSPDEVEGKRYRVRWPDSDHALYVILNDILEHGRKRPWEVFLISNDAESDEWRVALGRMISAVYRRGGDVAFVASELQAIFDKKGGAWIGGKHVASLPAAIGAVIERHMRSTGFLPPAEENKELAALAVSAGMGIVSAEPASPARAGYRQCPRCGQAALIRIENCDQCTSCAYSKC